jgi:NADPH-ferrihemoprotein reductase
VLVLYGTQTGTAERFAKELAKEMRENYGGSVPVQVVDAENYDGPSKLSSEKVVFMVFATYGDGEPTDNAARFYDWLVKAGHKREEEGSAGSENDAPLGGVSFGVFGLGNRQYEHFNAVGKRLDAAMRQMGARALVPRGDGDDDACIEDDYAQWKQEVWKSLDKTGILSTITGVATNGRAPLSPLSVNGVGLNGAPSPTSAAAAARFAEYDVETYDRRTRGASLPQETAAWVSPGPQYDTRAYVPDVHYPCLARVAAVRELHSVRSERSCVHVEIDIAGTPLSYEAGDHVGVFCENAPGVVSQALRSLGWEAETLVELRVPPGRADDLPAPFPGPISLGRALARYADLLSVPRKGALLALAESAADEKQRARLRLLGSPEGRQEYQDHVAKPLRSLLEVLAEFPSCRPSVGLFFASVAPRLQPRYYSISSAPQRHPECIHVTCAVVKETSPTGRVHEGVCSNWFKRIAPGTRVPVFVRRSQFRLPENPAVPVLMVGPGTGLAPFRGFLQAREELQRASGAKLGPAALFFGCRDRTKDFIYEGELRDYEKKGVLSSLSVAFSREQAGTKEYVQHHLARDAAHVWDLVDARGGYVYVCGDAKHMAKDVHAALVKIAHDKLGGPGSKAEEYVQRLHEQGRYLRDVW